MSIIAEYCPELCLREFNSPDKIPEECIPKSLEINKIYNFLKKGQRHYWIEGEIALRKTKGQGILSRPIGSVIILESTHHLKKQRSMDKRNL